MGGQGVGGATSVDMHLVGVWQELTTWMSSILK